MKYMRDSLEDKYNFLELQDKILEIAVDIDAFCEENGIDYCLMGGSALGAKRHGGFIPWDDDLDIFMTPDNYEKFSEIFLEKGDSEKYYLQEWGLVDGMVTISKVRLNNTTYIEESLKDYDIHHGIYIDIFILHNCADSVISRVKQCFWAKYVIMKGLAARGYDRRTGIIGLALKFMALFPEYFLVKHGLKQVYKYRNKKTKCFCNFMGKAVYKNAIYKREWFENSVYAPFEKVQLKIPENLHDFLTFRFGDYMIPPSPERIKWEQHAQFWDTKKDFREYCGNVKSFSDEKKLL